MTDSAEFWQVSMCSAQLEFSRSLGQKLSSGKVQNDYSCHSIQARCFYIRIACLTQSPSNMKVDPVGGSDFENCLTFFLCSNAHVVPGDQHYLRAFRGIAPFLIEPQPFACAFSIKQSVFSGIHLPIPSLPNNIWLAHLANVDTLILEGEITGNAVRLKVNCQPVPMSEVLIGPNGECN
jgi:hypothetical protein